MKNYHLVKVKYLPATNTRGSRVKLTSERLKESIVIAYDYSLNSIIDMAERHLKLKKQRIIGQANQTNEDYIILDSINNRFKSIL